MFEWIYAFPATVFGIVMSLVAPTPAVVYDQTIIASYVIDAETQLEKRVTDDYYYYVDSAHHFSKQDDVHEWMWKQFVGMGGVEFTQEHVSGFDIFIDTPAMDQLAYVVQDYNDPTKWIVAFDIEDMFDDPSTYYQTVIHEFAHLLTLESDQAEVSFLVNYYGLDDETYWRWYDVAVDDCETYFTGESCVYEDSYLYAFVQRFWLDIFDEYGIVDTNYDGDFSAGRKSEFLSWYAGTNPGEDIAESFMYFVLRDRATGTAIEDQKQNFFYEYPELVELRNDIRDFYGEEVLKVSNKVTPK